MKHRIAALLLASCFPLIANSWVELGTHYPSGVIQVQLGDICDSARFPLTPGNCSGDVSNPDWRSEIIEAHSRWHAATPNITFTTDAGVGASVPGTCDPDDSNSAFFLDNICGSAFGGSTLAVAKTFKTFHGVAIHSDVVFNTAWTWGAFDDALSNHPGVIDFRRVAVHEFGHVAGLGHPFHSNAIMAPTIQESMIAPQPDDIAGISAIYGVSEAFVIDDQNGNSVDELVHVRLTTGGAIRTEIRDAGTGGLLRSMTYSNSGSVPIDAVLLPDEDGNGSAELAVLALRLSDSRASVMIRNIGGTQSPRQVFFSAGLTPLQLKYVGDTDGNGVSEVAMLAVRESDLRTVVEVVNVFGTVARRQIFFANSSSPLDMDVIFDPLGVAPPRLVVLLMRLSDQRGVAELRNSFGAEDRTVLNAAVGVFPLAVAVVKNSIPQVSILSFRKSDGRAMVETQNATGTPSKTTQFFAPGAKPLELVTSGDVDGDGQPEMAVLSIQTTNGRVIVEIRNVDGSNKRTATLLAGFDSPGSMGVLNDADGDTFAEIGVLLSRQTDARLNVEWMNAAGPNTAATHVVWYSP